MDLFIDDTKLRGGINSLDGRAALWADLKDGEEA